VGGLASVGELVSDCFADKFEIYALSRTFENSNESTITLVLRLYFYMSLEFRLFFKAKAAFL